MQTINSFIEGLPLHRNRVAELNGGVFICARAPNFAVRNESAPNFPSVHQWSMILDRDVRQRDALLYLCSLADVRQIQIVLRKDGCAKSGGGEINGKQLKRRYFHNFDDYPSQIFETPLPVKLRNLSSSSCLISGLVAKSDWAFVFTTTDAPLSLASNASSPRHNPGMKPTFLALLHRAPPRIVPRRWQRASPTVGFESPLG